jgi:hypothetical protein
VILVTLYHEQSYCTGPASNVYLVIFVTDYHVDSYLVFSPVSCIGSFISVIVKFGSQLFILYMLRGSRCCSVVCIAARDGLI